VGEAVGRSPLARAPDPIALVPRDQLEEWTALAAGTARPVPGATASEVLEVLHRRGAMFLQELVRAARLPPASVEEGLAALVACGRVTCDAYGGLRWLLLPAWRRVRAGTASGRWCVLRHDAPPPPSPALAEFVARRLLHRTGVLFRRTVARERIPVPWRDVARACRTLEARGEIRGGRFVAGFDGEQYALPEAVAMLRRIRRERGTSALPVRVCAADPLNFQGILTPEGRIRASAGAQVEVG
jgi:ATP-dependent Lhr-like helicase